MGLENWLGPRFIGSAAGFPAALQLDDGNFMVVYSTNGQNGLNFRVFDPFGETLEAGNLFPGSTDINGVLGLTPLEGGGFTLLYAAANSDGRSLNIQNFDANRQPTSDPITFGTDYGGGTNGFARFAQLPDGGYIVGYNLLSGTEDFWDVRFLLIDADGTVGDPLPLDSSGPGQQYSPRVATNGDNIFISWYEGGEPVIYGQMLGLDGTALTETFLVHSSSDGRYRDPQIGVLSNGNYVVTFSAEDASGADSDRGSARARLFGPTGTPLGDEFVLNEEPAGNQGAPNLTVLPDDSFIVSYFGTGGGHRWFNPDGTPRTDTLQSQLPLSQTSLVTIGDGRFAVFGVDSGLSFEIIDGRMGQLDGDEGDNILLSTRTGDTTINGFGGDDQFFGNDDNDTFFGGEGNDTFRGRGGQDTFAGGPGDDIYYFTPFSLSGDNRTTIIEEAGEGIDTLFNHGFLTLPSNVENGVLIEDAGTSELDGNGLDNRLVGNSFNNILNGNLGRDTLIGGAGNDQLTGGNDDDTIDGGEGDDVAIFRGPTSAFDIRAGASGSLTVTGGTDGTDMVTNVERLRFDDNEVMIDQGGGLRIDPARDDPDTFMFNIRDFDGNELGGAFGWVSVGRADANLDGTAQAIFVNAQIGRFAQVGLDEGLRAQFSNHGEGGDTRVVGIYIDPLVESGDVAAGSDFDSQSRFQNDLFIGNISTVLGSRDYDADGFAEIYFALSDGTAYLRALMHADGNIQYANYQSQQQVIDYLSSLGFGEETYGDWFGGNTGVSGGDGPVAAAPAISAVEASQLFYAMNDTITPEFYG